MKKKLILLLFPIITWSQSYVGHVGDLPIHLELDIDEDQNNDGSGQRVDGFYFYDSKLISIPLRGVFIQDTITVVDGWFYSEDKVGDAKEVFRLQKTETQLTGVLQLKKEEYTVVLTKTEQDPITSFRNPKLTFKKDSVSTYQDKQLVWFHERFSKTQLFRLGNGYTKAQRTVFNSILDTLHLEDAEGMLDCSSFELSTVINRIDDRFISFTKYYSVYCGGAHPSYGGIGYTFDLTTLQEVASIESLYPNVDFFQVLKTKYYDSTDEYQDDCEVFVDESNWEYKRWNLTTEGVLLTPNYPHVMKACEEDYFLSYDEIKN
ncbi:hypothetical protein [Olleya sp. Bg11-27]|uniref:hypothetical protein n=1 Tax=Olleya sp. Bg11-27 TaxID=2058135 RepID=UPI000C30A7A5|nr:hypothetical protein [Olleya sp. Bg11-27]AUC75053.1 hypothetical protein CW732_04935 [Olleya sp. Bg11-27]